MAMPIGQDEEAELNRLMKQVEGNSEAEDHIQKVLSAVSGTAGMSNVTAIMGDHVADSIKEAESFKAEGNRLFASGSFEEAITQYEQGAALFKDYTPQVLSKEAKKMLVTLYSNSAQACLKLGIEDFPDGARHFAEQALKFEPTNVKARFRRGCAYVQLKDFSKARDDFEWVLREDPSNDVAKKELRSVLKLMKSEKANAPSGQQPLSKALDDPRSAPSEPAKPAADMPAHQKAERHIAMCKQLKRAAFKYLGDKGRLHEWTSVEDDLQIRSERLATMTMAQIAKLLEEGQLGPRHTWSSLLGPKGELFAELGEEQRKRYIDADSYVTTVKETFTSDFNEIVGVASTM